MAFELSIQSSGKQEIQFVGYDKTLEDVRRLVTEMEQQEVTEENIQTSKKLIASINKQIKELDKERLAVKREIMTPYDELNEKIQLLKSELNKGVTHINVQIKEITAKEQEERRLQIKTLFKKYQKSYNAPQWLTFDKFIARNSTLVTNKATSNKKIREAVVSYFQAFNNDYAELKKQFTDKDERSAILIAYSKNGHNMQEAILDYTSMIAEKERLEIEQRRVKETKVPDIVIITGNEQKQEAAKPVEYVTIKIKKEDLNNLNIDYEVIK
ncbi:protein of unknown function DUF1351 [Enterococcus phage 9184]|uniref:DUF1351 domain-containing protein n=1 Tax=Enterococcus phage 9184 TaxID=2763103 RepID=A0A7L8ZIH1_9CAUD|nr:protein of unknown function DUF1351 [Enterococcus phage 9184]